MTLVRLASPRLRQEATYRMAAFVFSIESLKAPLQKILKPRHGPTGRSSVLCCEGR